MNIEKELSTRLNNNPRLEKIKENIANNLSFTIVGYEGFFKAFLINKIKKYSKTGKIILVVKDENTAEALKDDLNEINSNTYMLNYFSPLVYQGISSKSKVFSERVKFLINFYKNKPGVYIVLLKSFLSKVPSKDTLLSNIYRIKKSNNINTSNLERELIKLGYEKATRVNLPGEFTVKGEIIDIFVFETEKPYRIVLNFEQIEEIKHFDYLTQLKEGNEINEFEITPKKEIIWNESSINKLKTKIKESEYKELFEELNEKHEARAEEIFYSLVADTCLKDEIDAETPIINYEITNFKDEIDKIQKEYEKLYLDITSTGKKTIEPKDIFLNSNEFELNSNIQFTKFKNSKIEEVVEFKVESERNFFSNIQMAREQFQSWLNDDFKVIIASESESQKQKLKYLFKDIPNLGIEVFKISSSLIIEDVKIAIILESDIFNTKQKISKAFETSRTRAIDSFVELEANSYVVHINHGIGIFRQIKRIKTSSVEKDYIEIEYADSEKLFIPIEQTNLIQKYIGSEAKHIRLDKIGSRNWEKKKSLIKKRIDDIADSLIELYSKRESIQGYIYPSDNEWQMLFESEFPYDETKDQVTAIAEIKNDMMRARVMDRLLCGDVGFGKTEVAMRAAFKAVMGGKQVAILAPTTILTEQHFNTFKKRFKNFPIKIEMLSRFVKNSKEKEVIEKLQNGELDILIGTHKILSKKLVYKNLGLIVIDEEQRFGVKEKEKLKQIKASVDCLALSATPIPRSLHMSLIKLRDISVLKTPPRNRVRIETYVEGFNELLIKHAIENELARDGQVFFVHHNIKDLDTIKVFIEKIVPYARIATLHARLSGEQIENIMYDFINKSYQVLLATTIIENGIDIPNANTIIVNNANRFGLSQLYQLKGRVGRSSEKAFAYFLYPENAKLNEESVERLKAISEFSELGAGFKIAMKDMEIRGIGNLLGREQHGEIESIGLDYYLTLLNRAIEKRIGKNFSESEITIEINYNGFIPDSYVDNEQDKILIYKKISGIQTEDENKKIREEIYDRFGPIPKELNTLLLLAELQVFAKNSKIVKMKEDIEFLEIEYLNMENIPVEKVMRVLETNVALLKIKPEYKNSIFLSVKGIEADEKINYIYQNLNLLI